jgi:hypothetical protein
MSSLIGHMAGFTQLQQGATAAGNGDSLNLTGAVRGLLLVQWDEATGDPVETYDGDGVADGSALGALIFETSHDGGSTWDTASVARRLEDDDSFGTFSTIDSGSIPALLKISHLTGQVLLRARVTSEFDEPISVFGVAVGR